jgi:hypothetical protein
MAAFACCMSRSVKEEKEGNRYTSRRVRAVEGLNAGGQYLMGSLMDQEIVLYFKLS